MLKSTLLLLLSLLVGCGVKLEEVGEYPAAGPAIIPIFTPVENAEKFDDPEITAFADELIDIIEAEGVATNSKHVYYHFADLQGERDGVIGTCQSYEDANVIRIDTTWWATATIWSQRSLVYHEMGHCVLNRGHRTLYYQGPNAIYDGGFKPSWPSVSRYNQDGSLNAAYRGEWPLSLLGRSTVSGDKFELEYDYYMTELLHGNDLVNE